MENTLKEKNNERETITEEKDYKRQKREDEGDGDKR